MSVSLHTICYLCYTQKKNGESYAHALHQRKNLSGAKSFRRGDADRKKTIIKVGSNLELITYIIDSNVIDL